MSKLSLLSGTYNQNCTAVQSKYYPGNKNIDGYIHKIVNNIPMCHTFMEVFSGSGAISNYLFQSVGSRVKFHLNDIDRSVTDSFNYPSGSTVTNFSFQDLLQSLLSLPAASDVFLFCDPPYMYSTRPGNTDIYNFEMSDSDHVLFLQIVQSINNNCMITHPACDLYNKMLYGWRTVDVKVRYHNKTSLEHIYMNYDHPDRLITYKLLGSDCWDRQRIKRKISRRLKSLEALPYLEREYFLNEISKLYFNSAVRKDITDLTGSQKFKQEVSNV